VCAVSTRTQARAQREREREREIDSVLENEVAAAGKLVGARESLVEGLEELLGDDGQHLDVAEQILHVLGGERAGPELGFVKERHHEVLHDMMVHDGAV
jgi:hypothetical protein